MGRSMESASAGPSDETLEKTSSAGLQEKRGVMKETLPAGLQARREVQPRGVSGNPAQTILVERLAPSKPSEPAPISASRTRRSGGERRGLPINKGSYEVENTIC